MPADDVEGIEPGFEAVEDAHERNPGMQRAGFQRFRESLAARHVHDQIDPGAGGVRTDQFGPAFVPVVEGLQHAEFFLHSDGFFFRRGGQQCARSRDLRKLGGKHGNPARSMKQDPFAGLHVTL